MLNEVKHPHTGFLAGARSDIFGLVMLTSPCHAERSASAAKHPHTGFLALARNDIFGLEKACGMIYSGSGYFDVS